MPRTEQRDVMSSSLPRIHTVGRLRRRQVDAHVIDCPPSGGPARRYLALMKPARSIQFKTQHIVAIVAVVAAGVIVGRIFGLWAGIAAAIVVLGANEAIERARR